jgi:hypothetical protein
MSSIILAILMTSSRIAMMIPPPLVISPTYVMGDTTLLLVMVYEFVMGISSIRGSREIVVVSCDIFIIKTTSRTFLPIINKSIL